MKIGLEKTLNKNNIDKMIGLYMKSINEMDTNISENNILTFLNKIKRDNVNKGPYPDVTLFEAANRIMSYLVILFGIKQILYRNNSKIIFPKYHVEYGNGHDQEYDIMAEHNGIKLIGEAFNVAPSFFQGKKVKSLKKLRNSKSNNNIKILLYNSDAGNKK
jgi:hypothetical protein